MTCGRGWRNSGYNARILLNLRKRMAKIRVFDPACGSGNFLVIAYKEMRAIEAEINKRRGEPDLHTEIPLTNFAESSCVTSRLRSRALPSSSQNFSATCSIVDRKKHWRNLLGLCRTGSRENASSLPA